MLRKVSAAMQVDDGCTASIFRRLKHNGSYVLASGGGAEAAGGGGLHVRFRGGEWTRSRDGPMGGGHVKFF
jgi:hypothetical protein